MYIFLPIVLAVMVLTWSLLRRFTRKWIEKPPTILESIFNGTIAWTFVASLLFWFVGILYLLIDFLYAHQTNDIWALVFSVMLTGYGIDFYFRSKSDMMIDDTTDFIKEELQFRRSTQRRLDLLSLIELRRKQRKPTAEESDPQSLQRLKLQANLDRGKELEVQLALLREGKFIDISEVWRTNIKMRSAHPLYEKVTEARIDPHRRRLTLFADFSDLDEAKLKDDTTVLRFNRQVYDFLQSMNTEPWLRPYAPFIESYFLLCRITRVANNGEEILYPFMKVGILVSELYKLEGTYFNPRKLAEIATIAFHDGAPV